MPTDETKAFDVIDKVFSLEGANLDKDGAKESIKELSNELLNNNRFTEVKKLDDIDFRTPKLDLFPVPLSWDIVAQICKEKGTDNFKIARRKAQMGNWDAAAVLWEKETDNPKMKIAGRACYNMAIISEINGDLDAALGWAQKSYEDYNDKLAIRYTRILENRRYKNDVLKMQEGK
jgi:hypothetical protein